jgi:hypothetical protein
MVDLPSSLEVRNHPELELFNQLNEEMFQQYGLQFYNTYIARTGGVGIRYNSTVSGILNASTH